MSTPKYSDPITLEQPIKRGEQEITEIRLRRPNAGELRGLKLVDLLQMDVNALTELVPRISSPTLIRDDVSVMPPADLLKIGGEVASFLLPMSQQPT